MKRVFVSGANGFLGQALTKHFLAAGYFVFAGARNSESLFTHTNLKYIQYSLNSSSLDFNQINGCDAIVHCAWQMSGAFSEQKEANLEGVKKLLEYSKKKNIHFIFISSMAAHSKAQSSYGRLKLLAEESVGQFSLSTTIRPGTIVGAGGLFKRTEDLLKKIPIIPIFYGGHQELQLIGVDELALTVIEVIEKKHYGLFSIASFPGVEVSQMYRLMANKLGLKRGFISLPGDIFLFFIRIFESFGLRLPISSDNLLGLKYHAVTNTKSDWEKLWGESGKKTELPEASSYFKGN